jgi:two-component system sensor histidine kinase ChiS
MNAKSRTGCYPRNKKKILHALPFLGLVLLVSCGLEPGTEPRPQTPAPLIRLDLPLISPAFVEESALQGKASYSASLNLDVSDGHYALFLPGAAECNSIKANGTTIYQRGRDPDPGTVLHFNSPPGELSLAIESGPDGVRLDDPGLIPRPILVGGNKELDSFIKVCTSAAAVETGFFAICGFFVFILFLFWRKNGGFLSLSFFMEGAGLFTLGRTASLFGLYSLPRPWLSFISLASGLLLVVPLAFLFGSAFRGKAGKVARRACIAASITLAAASSAVIFLPGLERAFHITSLAWYALFFLVSLAFLSAAAAQRERRAWWLLPTGCLSFLALLGQELLPASLAASLFLESASLVVFSFVAMLMLLKKIGDSFEATETLTDYVSNVTSTLGRFIPREFLECLDKADVTDLRLGDHVKKEMTIFFSDIRSFTELSEKLTVEENFAFINSYLSRMVPVLAENGGFVDKYIGDGIMALFAGKQGPDQAIRAAIAMQVKMVEYNKHRANSGYRPIGMGVGIHTGDLMLGVIGVNDRMENTVISDAVNLASRLQSVTKAFNITLAISEQAFKELEDPGVYKYRFIGKVKVKGKSAPVSVFEIFDGIAPELFEKKMKANTYFEQGMLAYYQKDFSGAMYYFKRVLEIMPEDGAAAFYLETCINKAEL